jgi:CAAX protease family protein
MRVLLTFFSLTYALSWGSFIGAAVVSGATGTPLAALRGPLFLLGTFAPALVSLGLLARTEGRAAALALLQRIGLWRVKAGWYAFAVSYMAVVKLFAALVLRVTTGGWPRFGHETWYVIAAAIISSTWAQAGEEIGWRGFALPRLATRLGLSRAGLLLGVIWAVWHLPLFFISGIDKTGQSFPVFLLEVTALSVTLAWLYWRTNGSLLLTMLMHSAVNQTIGIVPSTVPGASHPFGLSSSLVAWVTLAILWAGAGYFLVRMRKARFPAELEMGETTAAQKRDGLRTEK